MVIDPDRAYLLDEVGLALAKPMHAFPAPGGRWLTVQRMCGLRLNSPREAIEILRSLKQSRIAAEMERAARPIGRPPTEGAAEPAALFKVVNQ